MFLHVVMRCLYFVFFIFPFTAFAYDQQVRTTQTRPVNNLQVIPPFPVTNDDETIWNKKLREYIYSYQVRYGNIGDKFVLPEDMEAFLETVPHGTTDKPIVAKDKQDEIASVFDDNYEQNIVDQYYKMQYRVLAPTIK